MSAATTSWHLGEPRSQLLASLRFTSLHFTCDFIADEISASRKSILKNTHPVALVAEARLPRGLGFEPQWLTERLPMPRIRQAEPPCPSWIFLASPLGSVRYNRRKQKHLSLQSLKTKAFVDFFELFWTWKCHGSPSGGLRNVWRAGALPSPHQSVSKASKRTSQRSGNMWKPAQKGSEKPLDWTRLRYPQLGSVS